MQKRRSIPTSAYGHHTGVSMSCCPGDGWGRALRRRTPRRRASLRAPLAPRPLTLGDKPGDVVGTDAVAEHRRTEALSPVTQRLQALGVVGVEACPGPRVLLRPEEVHPRSAPGAVLGRSAHNAGAITHHHLRLDRQRLLVAHA